MLQHHFAEPQTPKRVVVLGTQGFIGRRLIARLNGEKIPLLAIGSADLDLTAPTSAKALATRLGPDDALVMLSAITPDKGRDAAAVMKNLTMAQSVCAALAERPVAHAVYISSDAVYSFERALVNEASPAAPLDLYGCMHRTREIMFQALPGCPVAVLRPTMVYGADDTHNSYGPNRFRRMAAQDGRITLGGNGEETRDHIFIEDVVGLIAAALRHRSSGVLNLATGRSTSFHDVAKLVAARAGKPAEIVLTPRSSPITHRAFDVTACRKAFPDFLFTSLEAGLDKTQAAPVQR